MNDPDARFMKNKKGQWEFDYNSQIAVDEHKVIIVVSYVTNKIYGEMPSNFQVSADNGYSTA